MIFNSEYFSLWREIWLMAWLEITKKNNPSIRNNKILIACPCLIGEFAAVAPAIYDFIQRNGEKQIDLLVTAPIKILAERISGIKNIYISHSIFKRENEELDYTQRPLDSYETIIVLRASDDAIRLIRGTKSGKTKTAFSAISKYGWHLFKNMIIGRRPKRWSTVNFEILGGHDRLIPFNKIFKFAKDYLRHLDNFSFFLKTNKKIIIHTAAKWPMKKWSNDKWIKLLNKINLLGDFSFIFIGNDDDKNNFDYISPKLDFSPYSIINKTNLLDLALIFKKADYFIGIDSGPSNLAHLVGLKSMTIYGPGPHMFMSANPDDIILDASKGRGLLQMYYSSKNPVIERITVNAALSAFKKMAHI